MSEKVYKVLGAGYNETIYQRALMEELNLKGIPYEFERVIPIMYNNKFIGYQRADIVIDNNTVLELKATPTLVNYPEKYQLLKYLENLNLKNGIIINFPQPSRNSEKLVINRVPNFLEINL